MSVPNLDGGSGDSDDEHDRQLDVANNRIAQLTHQLNQSTGVVEATQREARLLRGENDRLQQRVENAEMHNFQLQTHNDELQTQNRQLQTQNDQLQTQLDATRTLLVLNRASTEKTLQQQLAQKDAELAEKDAQIAQLQEQLKQTANAKQPGNIPAGQGQVAPVAEQYQDEDSDRRSLDFWLQSLPAGPSTADENDGGDRGGSPASGDGGQKSSVGTEGDPGSGHGQ
ncbi:hypothetical protein AAVH_12129 [Aphelenchoides avenae]|nr:hypothetical protein AAVH_12129 [Aphelenchus avenae]